MGARIVELIHSDSLIGSGETNDPYRRIEQVYTKDGQLVVSFDPYTCLWTGGGNGFPREEGK